MNLFIKNRNRRQAGFSLIELMVSILILVVVMGVIFKQVDNIQINAKREAVKLDLTQESREFVDQFARDIHMSGYPISKLYQTQGGINDQHVAAGLVEASATALRFEGDVYGDGTVYSVVYAYFQNDPNDPNCPCLRRSVLQKVAGDPRGTPVGAQTAPQYYTQVQNVVDPKGQAQGIFTYFKADGTEIDPGAGLDLVNNQATIQQIDAIKVNLNTLSKQYDPQTGRQTVNNIATIAELEN
jgi:prepilin-type N-terminal cleavage/methylation domain-containing protein